MTGANELCVVFEPRWDGLAPMGVALTGIDYLGRFCRLICVLYLDEFDHMSLFFLHSPFIEGLKIRKDERITII